MAIEGYYHADINKCRQRFFVTTIELCNWSCSEELDKVFNQVNLKTGVDQRLAKVELFYHITNAPGRFTNPHLLYQRRLQHSFQVAGCRY